MPKNIVILLDGTSNEIESARTNVLRLYGCLTKSTEQLVYYDPGVGTFGRETTWSQVLRRTQEIWGMATGDGIDTNVKEAYRFLVENYRIDPDTGARDRIYLFGFSRGAYTSRILAAFLQDFGLMAPRNLNLLPYAFRAYKRIEAQSPSLDEISLHKRILQPDRPPVELLGLFDTVTSVFESGFRLRYLHSTRRNPLVRHVRHACAIAERRTMYVPQLWPERQLFDPGNPDDAERTETSARQMQDAREVWFAGVHGDVGGSYSEEESALAKVPLNWMIEQTTPMGLQYDDRLVGWFVHGQDPGGKYARMDPLGMEHDSMNFWWKLVEYIPQTTRPDHTGPSFLGLTIPADQPRVIPNGARIHHSVLQRGSLPANVPADHVIEGDTSPDGDVTS